MTDWDKERQQARETLTGELESERATRMAELHNRLEQEREMGFGHRRLAARSGPGTCGMTHRRDLGGTAAVWPKSATS